MEMVKINLGAPVLTRERIEEIVRQNLPELKDVEFSTCRNDTGEWWWGTGEDNENFEHDWSGYVHPDGRFEGPF